MSICLSLGDPLTAATRAVESAAWTRRYLWEFRNSSIEGGDEQDSIVWISWSAGECGTGQSLTSQLVNCAHFDHSYFTWTGGLDNYVFSTFRIRCFVFIGIGILISRWDSSNVLISKLISIWFIFIHQFDICFGFVLLFFFKVVDNASKICLYVNLTLRKIAIC